MQSGKTLRTIQGTPHLTHGKGRGVGHDQSIRRDLLLNFGQHRFLDIHLLNNGLNHEILAAESGISHTAAYPVQTHINLTGSHPPAPSQLPEITSGLLVPTCNSVPTDILHPHRKSPRTKQPGNTTPHNARAENSRIGNRLRDSKAINPGIFFKRSLGVI